MAFDIRNEWMDEPTEEIPENPAQLKLNMSETKTTKPLPVNANTLALIKLEPTNATHRALVCRQMGKEIPGELTTYDEILKWIETNTPETPKIPPCVRIVLLATDVEHGTVTYTAMRTGTGTFQLSADDILELAEAAGSQDELRSGLYEELEQWAIDNIAMGYCDGAPGDNVDPDGTKDFSVDYSHSAAMQSIAEVLKQLAPEEYERLFE